MRVIGLVQGNVPADLPTNFVIKLSPDEFGTRMFGRWMLFANETTFYSEKIGDRAGFRTAECFFADYSRVTGEVTLFLEDLSHLTSVGYEVGWTVPQAKAMISSAAKLHAHYWEFDPSKTSLDGPDLSRLIAMHNPPVVKVFNQLVNTNAPLMAPLLKDELGVEISDKYVSLLNDDIVPNLDVIRETGFFVLDRKLTVV